MRPINFHEKLKEIQAHVDGVVAIQILQEQGLEGHLFPVPFRNSDIEDSPENILQRDLSIGATLVEQVSGHLHLMGAQTMQHIVNINGVQYQFIAQLLPVQGEALQEAIESTEQVQYEIIINGLPHIFSGSNKITYEWLLGAIGVNPDLVYTVTFSSVSSGCGSLISGESVLAENGIVFNIANTGNA